MATTKISNFSQQNTPPFWNKLGNVLLAIGGAGAVVAILPLSAPLVTTIAAWVAVAGALGKMFTKTKGE